MRFDMRIILPLLLLLFLVACSKIPSECTGLDDQEEALCIIDLATSTGDAQLCNAIKDPAFKIWCANDVALTIKDEAACDVLDGRQRELCQRDLAFQEGFFDRCGTFENATINDDCYNHFARETANWTRCLPMQSGDFKEECLLKVSRGAKDPYGCLELQAWNPERESCVLSMSIASRNPTPCFELTGKQKQLFCVINVAAAAEDEGICDALEEDDAVFCVNVLSGKVNGSTLQPEDL